MSTFFMPGIPSRSGHPGVLEELQTDSEGEEVSPRGVLLLLEASPKNLKSHFLKMVHLYISQLTDKPCITGRHDNPDTSASLEEQAPDLRDPACSVGFMKLQSKV